MSNPDEKLDGHALKTLRTALRATQEVVAEAWGVVPSYVSGLETGTAARERYEAAAGAMGAPPEAIDWTLEYLAKLEGTVRRPGPPGTREEEARRERRWIAAEFGQRAGEMMLELLEWWGDQMAVIEEKQRAHYLLNRLGWKTPEARRALVQTKGEYQTWGLALLLCDRSLQAAPDSAAEAIELARLAVLVAELAPGDEAWRALLLGFCLAHLANALRVQGELKEADRTYARGLRLWGKGKGAGPVELNEARVLGFGASLRRAQRRFEEGLELIEQALAVDQGGEAPRLLVKKSTVLREMGDLEAALEVLHSAESLLASAGDPRLALAVHLNATDYLSMLGNFEAVQQRLPEVWRLAEGRAGELDRIRLMWVHGRTAADSGHAGEGTSLLEEVRSEFMARRMLYDFALASLELALYQLKRGNLGQVKVLAREMAPVFEGQEIHREALAALHLFRQVAEQECATVELVAQVVRYLHRARHNPELPFSPDQAGG
jgi:tetratricopeptide (TPR) repeat protein